MEIPEISKLERIYSPEILIHGIPWKFQVCKKGESLAAFLHCGNADKSPNWSLWGCASFKLLPFSDDTNPIEHHSEPYVFNNTSIGYGATSLMLWNDLFNENKKFVKDDKINLEVKVTAEDPNDPNRSRVDLECIHKCCDNCHFSKFRLTVTNVLNLMAVQSPQFTLRGLHWNIQLSKKRSHLNIWLRLKNKNEANKMTMTIKLISSKNGVPPIEKCVTEEYGYLSIHNIQFASWEEMVKPENGFVNDNSIILELELGKLDPVEEPAVKRAKPSPENEAKSPQMKCPICSKCIANQELAVTTCGHMFCFKCIKNALADHAACPKCTKVVRLNGLRQLYLPTE